jgi:hypothetical protein
MFIGAVPVEVAEQITRNVPMGDWKHLFLCCSGSFRMEQAFSQTFKALRIHSNDVSLYTTAVGNLILGRQIPFTFRDRMAFAEEALEGRSYHDRVAAIILAHEMSRYAASNPYMRKHFDHYRTNFGAMLDNASAKLAKLLPLIRIESYFGGDWRVHADAAITHFQETGEGGIATFPPFFRGGYEKLYKFLDESVAWEPRPYDIYDPKMLDSIILKMEEVGIPYCLISDQTWPHRKPKMEYIAGRRMPHYGYWTEGRSSVRHLWSRPEPFKYRPIDPALLHENSVVEVIPARSAQMNHIKDVYLQKSIIHAAGLINFLVFIDKMLVGGIIYSPGKFGNHHTIYLLSDVTICREARMSKLVALMATSATLMEPVQKKVMNRITEVVTTAHSKHPISMKYRGIYQLTSRRVADNPEEGNVLQYQSHVRQQTPQEMYVEWYRTYGKKDSSSPINARSRRRRGGAGPADGGTGNTPLRDGPTQNQEAG